MFKKSITTCATLAAILLSGCGSGDNENQTNTKSAFELSIIHVNDSHSHLLGDNLSGTVNGVKTYFDVGGYPRMVTKINELENAHNNTLTLNAGDIFQGTLYYSLFKGAADAKAMNLVNWDAYELGNHAFDDGDEGLKYVLDRLDSNITVLAANVVPQSGNILNGYWKPYKVMEFGGQKVGIVGIDIVSKTVNSSSPSKTIDFLDEVQTAQKYIDQLSGEGVDKIVLLTHQGYSADLEMAGKLNGVDIIVGGDSHSLIGDFSAIGFESEANSYPAMRTSKDGKNVCVVQAWQYTYVVGNLNVNFDENGTVSSCEGTPYMLLGDTFKQKNSDGDKVEVNATVKQDILNVVNANANIEVVAENANARSVIKVYEDNISNVKNVVIGQATSKLRLNRVPMQEYNGEAGLNHGSEITPIVAKSFYDLSLEADISIQNGGGVRVSIDEGNITYGDAYTLLPFSNTLYNIKMTGAQVKQVLEDALNYLIDEGGSTGAFPYAYALKYNVDMNASSNNRVSALEVKDRNSSVWSDIDMSKIYTVVTNSYIAGGKDGYATFKTAQATNPGVDTYLDYAMSFVRYVEKKAKAGEQVSKLPDEDICIKNFTNVDGNVTNYK